ncbi:CheY-like chemotaxis protein [Bradyrhizobium sp. LM6.10]|jgi:CheY-like chemotaxis protein|uniref:response regulator n=1 Tax=unclassified Bradyrhizobium TaxID=2631580 RepID=UPI001FFB0A58|nr:MULTISPECIES: response regulator [unclassified Bradyrhizobium]MCK1338540.1 response regulator [Bradyrhizobium sp. 38]MCK1781917.1 response regulator [Bradyrhizobium sp. 132]
MVELSGARVLLVEDEGLVALMIEDMLEELGLKVVASAAHVTKACELATRATFDLALLDVNLAGKFVFPVARILRDRKIPFLFSTGYGGPPLEEEFRNAPAIGKPFSIDQLKEQLRLILALP